MRSALTLMVACLLAFLSMAGVALATPPAAPTISPGTSYQVAGTISGTISGPSGTTLYWSTSSSSMPADPPSGTTTGYGALSNNPQNFSVSLASGGKRYVKAVAKDNVTGEVSAATAATYTAAVAPSAPTISPGTSTQPSGTVSGTFTGPVGSTLYWATSSASMPADPTSSLTGYSSLANNPQSFGTSLAVNGMRYVKVVAKDNTTGLLSAPASATYTAEDVLFEDQFNGSSLDTTKWHVRNPGCGDDGQAYACVNPNNVSVHDGYLDLNVRKEGTGGIGPNAEPYSGAMVSTAKYGWGWPVPDVKASWTNSHHIKFRALYANPPGGWAGVWEMNTDKGGCYNGAPNPIPAGDANYELDIAEIRAALPTLSRFGIHKWTKPSSTGGCVDALNDSLSPTVSDTTTNWHVWDLDVSATGISLTIDGTLIGTKAAPDYGTYDATNWFLILSNWVGKPGTWGSGGGQPDSSLPVGPIGSLKVDYVKVTAN